MNLRQYEHEKFKLSELIQSAYALIRNQKNQVLEDRSRDLLARLAEDRFNLTMVGQFSRGKSSLLNAILGTDRLPTGIVPLTSVITAVSYGSTERVTVEDIGDGGSTAKSRSRSSHVTLQSKAIPETASVWRSPTSSSPPSFFDVVSTLWTRRASAQRSSRTRSRRRPSCPRWTHFCS